MAKDYIIGIDLGATKINTVLIDKHGKLIKRLKLKTKKTKQKIIEQVLYSIESISDKDVIAIGIGVPGILNKQRTEILNLPNIPGFKKIRLKHIIEKKIRKKVMLENDANCMALGESMFGYGRNVKNLVCVTLGTGIGAGIIINNKIYSGMGNAGEFGHITVDINGYKCKCGARGCLEEYVSVKGIKRIAKKLGISKNILEIYKMAKLENKKAEKVYEIAGTYLGIGLSTISKLLDPDLIVIGGGISNAGDLILKPSIKEMKKRTLFKTAPIKIVKLKDNSGAIGSACLFLKQAE